MDPEILRGAVKLPGNDVVEIEIFFNNRGH
jgi:hypothetical protein